MLLITLRVLMCIAPIGVWLAFLCNAVLLVSPVAENIVQKKSYDFSKCLHVFSSFYFLFPLSVPLWSTIIKLSLRVLVRFQFRVLNLKALCVSFNLHHFDRIFDVSIKSCRHSNFDVSDFSRSDCLHFLAFCSSSFASYFGLILCANEIPLLARHFSLLFIVFGQLVRKLGLFKVHPLFLP